MDYAAQYFIGFSQGANEINGVVEMVNDSVLKFKPQESWKTGSYKISVLSEMEDLASNNLNRPFDLDLEQQTEISEQAYHAIPFEISKR